MIISRKMDSKSLIFWSYQTSLWGECVMVLWWVGRHRLPFVVGDSAKMSASEVNVRVLL